MSDKLFCDRQVKDASGVPVWIQIRNHIVYLVRSGKLNPGDTLPTVRELAVMLGVNYNTVHKVYRDLETSGVLSSGRGRRTTIAKVDVEEVCEPKSPVDIVIKEFVRAVCDSGMGKEEALNRVRRALEGVKEADDE